MAYVSNFPSSSTISMQKSITAEIFRVFFLTYASDIENTYLLCDYFSFKAHYLSRKFSALLFTYRNALNDLTCCWTYFLVFFKKKLY